MDREKAALEGVDPDAVTDMLDDYLDGVVTTQIQRGPEDGRRARLDSAGAPRHGAEHRPRCGCAPPDGHLFPLSRVATVTR